MAINLTINKKAQAFSLIALLMSLLFIIIFSQLTHVPLDNQVPIIKTEISRIDAFVKNLDELVNNAIDRTSYQTLQQFSYLQRAMYQEGTPLYFDDVREAFSGCFENNSFVYTSNTTESLTLSCDNFYMVAYGGWSEEDTFDYSFRSYLENLTYLAEEIYDIEIELGMVQAQLELGNNPFQLIAHIQVTIEISKNDDYKWTRYVNVSRPISINGLAHPLFENRTISQSNYSYAQSFNISQFSGDVDVLASFIDNSFYYLDKTAPSILDLYEGNFTHSNNLYGISSILDDSFSQTGLTNVESKRLQSDTSQVYCFTSTNEINSTIRFPGDTLTSMGFSLSGLISSC